MLLRLYHECTNITQYTHTHTHVSESICCLVLNNYNTLSSWFILKAHNHIVAKEWLKQISAAQVCMSPR